MKKLPVVGLSCLLMAFVACNESDDSDPSGDGGNSGTSGTSGGKGGTAGKAGGGGKGGSSAGSSGRAGAEAGSGSGGESGEPGAGGSGEGGANEGGSGGSPECVTGGEGDVVVEIEGLPDGVDASVTLEFDGDSEEVTESGTLEGLDSGAYTVTAARVADSDPIVRTVYDPLVASSGFCLEDGGEHTITIEYRAIPSSNKLWTSNFLGFSAEDLAETATSAPSVVGDAGIGKDVAFDRDGNLWSLGATLAESMIVRVPAANLASSDDNDFDREINVPEVECIPALSAVAFDAEGNLWLGACGGNVLQIPASELASSGDAESETVFSGVDGVSDLAFDGAGNLWVAADGHILRYDESRLGASSTDAADLVITPRDAEDSRDLGATGLAFDGDGDLWGFDFGSNTIFEIAASALDGTGEQTVISGVSFVVGVGTLLDRGAFDEGGGLWISYATDQIARLSPTQLTMSAGSGAPVTPERIVTSTELDSGLRVALFPAPEGLPLYHRAFAE